jgi:biotin-dependent carboxylase-like uncharacterized protein
MIKILKPGLFSTIQDKGRIGLQSYGIPHSGSMDSFSSDLGNKILGNNKENAVMEITMTGPVLEFEFSTFICITGADLSPSVKNMNIPMNTVVPIKSNDILSFGALKSGLRAYIAVLGGFKTEKVYNSRSMYKNLTKAIKLTKNDTLEISNETLFANSKLIVDSIQDVKNELMVTKGPEYSMLNSSQKSFIISHDFTVSNNYNRMAVQLKDVLENNLDSIITSAVIPGTIQLTPNGTLIILMRDCQTTGGYPRILQLEERAINSVAQLKKDSKLGFNLKT